MFLDPATSLGRWGERPAYQLSTGGLKPNHSESLYIEICDLLSGGILSTGPCCRFRSIHYVFPRCILYSALRNPFSIFLSSRQGHLSTSSDPTMTSKSQYHEGLQVASPSQAGLEPDGRGLETAGNLPSKAEEFHSNEQFPQTSQTKGRHGSRTFCGLRTTTLLLALLIVLLVAAIAGIAGGLASRKTDTTTTSPPAQSSTSTSRESSPLSASSTTSPMPSATASQSPYVCTNNGTAYIASNGNSYTVYCNTDFLVGANYGTTAAVLTILNINSFGACLDACSISNALQVSYSNEGSCQSATWFSSGTRLDYCYLKNATANTNGSNGTYTPNDLGVHTGSLVS